MIVSRYALGACWSLIALATIFVLPVSAQHSDVFVYQDNGTLVPTDGTTPQFVYSRLFNFFGHPFGNTSLPKAFIADNPGFQTNNSAPGGLGSLPVGATLSADFLPFSIPGNVSGNVLHWAPSMEPVQFQPVGAGHFFDIKDVANNSGFILDGSLTAVEDVLLGLVSSANVIHEHISWRLDDGDGNTATDPASGVYLMMMRMRTDGVNESEPFALLLNSTDISFAEQNAAADWVTNQIGLFTILGDSVVGDFDGNNAFDLVDIDQLVAAVASSSSDLNFDVDADGVVDYDDVIEWLDIAGTANLPATASYMIGDGNLDGFVDVSDFNLWNASDSTSVAAWSRGDFNADGTVNDLDFNLWNGNKFRTPGSTQFVPEPNMLSLIGWLPLVGLYLRKRRS